jgi:hypothetical protein
VRAQAERELDLVVEWSQTLDLGADLFFRHVSTIAHPIGPFSQHVRSARAQAM